MTTATTQSSARTEKPTVFNVYPKDEEQRAAIVQAAKDQGMKTSPFLIHLALRHINKKKKSTPQESA